MFENQTEPTLRVIPLGGLGEIGLNMMVLEYDDTIVLVDAGLMFPEDEMLGIDIVIPDFDYLRKNRDRVTALVVTHGHEDHIGAIPFLLKEFALPIYGTALTLALIKEKLKEHNLLDRADLVQISPRPFRNRVHPGLSQHSGRGGPRHTHSRGRNRSLRRLQNRQHPC